MKQKADVELIKRVLTKVPTFSALSNRVKQACNQSGVCFISRPECNLIREINLGTSLPDEKHTVTVEAMSFTDKSWKSFPTFYFTKVQWLYPGIWFSYGPVIFHIFLRQAERRSSFGPSILIVTRSLRDLKSSCVAQVLYIRINWKAGKDSFGVDDYSKYVKDYSDDIINKLGKVQNGHVFGDVSEYYHYLLLHYIGSCIRALTLANEINDQYFPISKFFSLMDTNIFLRYHNISIQDFVNILSGNSLLSFMSSYFGNFLLDELESSGIFSTSCESRIPIPKVKWDHPFDILRFTFYLMSMIMVEIEESIAEIKDLCGDCYDSVLHSIFFCDSSFGNNGRDLCLLDMSTAFSYVSTSIFSRVTKNMEDRLKSLRCKVLPNDNLCLAILKPHVQPSLLSSLLNLYSELSINLIECLLEENKKFVFNNTLAKIREKLLCKFKKEVT